MPLYRYLLNIAYIGTPFRGAQRQVVGTFPRADDPLTIQGRLEMTLKRMRPVNEPCVAMSSRTDSGVHAISSMCHVDLMRQNGLPYNPIVITNCLNKNFLKDEIPIRVLKTFIVPENFSSGSNAISRTYLYRILVAKSVKTDRFSQFLPLEEWERSSFICTDTFDLEQMKECAKVLDGYHDFRSFMAVSSDNADRITRKHIDIKIEETDKVGYSPLSWPTFAFDGNTAYRFVNVYIKSSGFLYKQVRRTVGALVAVAQGKVKIRDIKFMLEVPSRHSWCSQLRTAPSHGLYLCRVEYSQEDTATFRTEAEDLS